MIRRTVFSLAVIAVTSMLLTSASRGAKLATGAQGPDFRAQSVDGKEVSLASQKDAEVVVVCFTCDQCPVARAYEDRLIDFAKKYAEKGVKFVAINVNRGENLDAMKERAVERGFPYPYAYDESGDSARAYGAQVTPHLFVLDKNRKVAYQGAFDDSMTQPQTPYLANAVDAVLAGKQPAVTSTRPVGCGIQPRGN